MFKTHAMFGLFLTLLLINKISLPHPIIFAILVTAFSSIPDLDHPKSKLGRKLPFISIPINLIFKHRGFFHSIFPPLILLIILYYFNLSFLGLAILGGYLVHLIGDSITREGISFLYPFTKFTLKGPIHTGGPLELVLFMIITILDIFLILKFVNIL